MRNLPAIEQQLSYLSWFGSDYLGVLFMGWFYGLTLCSFSCLPMLMPYLFASAASDGQGKGSGFMPAFDLTAIFIITRVVVYAALAAAAGGLGSMLLEWLDSGVLIPTAGLAIITVGVAVMFSRRKGCTGSARCSPSPGWRGTSHMVGLGMATSLMPCLPLTAILMLSATRGSMTEGAMLGLLFGVGAAATPLYYIAGATGWLATRIRAEIPKQMPLLQKMSGLILALFGLRLVLT